MRLYKILIEMFKFSPIKIILIWILDLIDVVLISLLPMIWGFAIDGLATKDFKWFIISILVNIIMLISGTVNRYFDTRTYSQIIEHFSIKYYDNELKKGTNTSIIDARLQLIDDFSSFLESDLLNIFGTFIGVAVSLMYIYNKTSYEIFLFSLILSIAVLLIAFKFNNKVMKNNKIIKDMSEKQHKILRKRKTLKYANYIKNVLKIGINNSDIDSLSYFISFLLQTVLLVISVFVVVAKENLMTGVIFATITYITNLNSDILAIPEQWLVIKDLIDSAQRIELD